MFLLHTVSSFASDSPDRLIIYDPYYSCMIVESFVPPGASFVLNDLTLLMNLLTVDIFIKNHIINVNILKQIDVAKLMNG